MKIAPDPVAAANSPLRIWAVSDGRAGIRNQVLGLAEAAQQRLETVGRPAVVEERIIRYKPIFERLPTLLKFNPLAMLSTDSDLISPPWPDIWIAAGRASLPFSSKIRQWSSGHSFVVQCQNPRHRLSDFDLVIAPLHDGLEADKAFSMIGATHRITPERLSQEKAQWLDRLTTLKGPRVCVLIGGASKTHSFTPARAHRMVAEIRSAVDSVRGSLLMSVSRRTPEIARRILVSGLSDVRGQIYEGTGENPYFAYLAEADYILVTEDSVNMAVEAATTGKPIYILKMNAKRASKRFSDFHQSLVDYGATRPFTGRLSGFRYVPLCETPRAANALVERFLKF